MKNFLPKQFLDNIDTIVFVLSVVIILQLFFSIFLFLKLKSKRTRSINSSRTNLELKNFSKELEELKSNSETLKTSLDFISESLKNKVGTPIIKRYNPFNDTGGNQSFSVAFLDENGSGVVVTNLFGRDVSKVYAKEIKDRKSEHPLSPEEEEVLKKFRKKVI